MTREGGREGGEGVRGKEGSTRMYNMLFLHQAAAGTATESSDDELVLTKLKDKLSMQPDKRKRNNSSGKDAGGKKVRAPPSVSPPSLLLTLPSLSSPSPQQHRIACKLSKQPYKRKRNKSSGKDTGGKKVHPSLSPVKRRDIGLSLSVCLSVRLCTFAWGSL